MPSNDFSIDEVIDPRYPAGFPPEVWARCQAARKTFLGATTLKKMCIVGGFEFDMSDVLAYANRTFRRKLFMVDTARFAYLMAVPRGTEGFKVVYMGNTMTDQKAAAALDRRGLRPVTLTECIVYAAKQPRKWRDHSEITFGSSLGAVSGPFNARFDVTPCLHDCGDARTFGFSVSRIDGLWHSTGRWLGISKEG